MKKVGPRVSFLSGMLTMAIIMALAGTALAAVGTVTYNQAGITLFGEVAVQSGEDFVAPNGQKVPSVITYTDAAGGKTNYLSIRQLSQLLDAEIAWNSSTGNVDIAPVGSGEVIVSSGDNIPEAAASPVYGTVAGPFEEIDPDSVDTSGDCLIQMENTQMISSTGAFAEATFRAKGGNYIVFTVTNNGELEQNVSVYRPITISNRSGEQFTEVKLNPGETLTRAFYLEDGASLLESSLAFAVDSKTPGSTTDVTMSLRQYK